MRKDRALAKELQAILSGLHDQTISEEPFRWSIDPEDIERRESGLQSLRDKLRSYVHVSRGGKIARLLGFGTVLPLAVFALLAAFDFPADVGARAWTWTLLLVTAVVFLVISIAVWWPPSIDEDVSFAVYAIPRGWSFSRRHGHAVWRKMRGRYSFFRRGDEDQAITARIWGQSGPAGEAVGAGQVEQGRAFMMFAFYWVEVEVRTRYNAATKKMETKTERIPHERHGIFVEMSESRIRLRITETGSADGLENSIRLEYGALNKAVDMYCRAADELEAQQFLSPAVQEIVMKFSESLPGMQLDFYPGHVLLVSALDFLDGAQGIRLNRNGAGFEKRLQPWIDEVESFRTNVDDGLRGIAKYND